MVSLDTETSNNGANKVETNTVKKGINRWEGLAIPGVVILMMLSAYLVFKFGLAPTHTINKGNLITPPFSVKNLPLEQAGELPLPDWSIKRWRLYIPIGDRCDDVCMENLYLTRQVHKLLAGKAHRVERYALLTSKDNSPEFTQVLNEEYPLLHRTYVDYSDFKQRLEKTSLGNNDVLAQHLYFLVDQEGYLMMSYSAEHEGKELLADLKRLLKYSYEN